MSSPRLEIADVFRQHGKEFLAKWGSTLTAQQRRVYRDICDCRTAACGARVEQCDQCSERTLCFNSCGNRHCPRCQSSARDRWLTKMARDLSSGSLLPRCLYAAVTTDSSGVSKCPHYLHLAVPGCIRSPAYHRSRSKADGCQSRVPCRSAHLESEDRFASSPALPRASRRSVQRSLAMDPQQQTVLPAGSGAWQQVSEPVPEAARCGMAREKAAVDRFRRASQTSACIWSVDLATETPEVGCLRKATVRRAGIRPEIPGTLHASSSHIERSPDLI